ncbi:MAG: hypothetical protein U1F43_29315 [Myxococcota bacterium]
MGGEKPYAGRLRGSPAPSHASVQSGGPGAHVGVDEWRIEAGLGWAPSDRFALALSAPLVVRDLDFGAAGTDDVTALGDPTVKGSRSSSPTGPSARATSSRCRPGCHCRWRSRPGATRAARR